MQLKLGFSVEKKMLYMQCINISVPVSLSTYIQWRVIKGAGGGGEVRGMWKDVTSRSTFQNRIISMQKYFRKNFPIAVLSANQDSLNKQLSFFLV